MVINLPTTALTESGRHRNCSGASVGKFEKFGLMAVPGRGVEAPLIAECHANFECKLKDDGWSSAIIFSSSKW